MAAHPYIAATEREVQEWPGAVVSFTSGTKHMRAYLRYRESSHFVVFSTSPSDGARGLENHIGEVRRTLRMIGATRRDHPKATIFRERNKPERDPLANIDPAPVKFDPFAILARIKPEETNMRTITIDGQEVIVERGIPLPAHPRELGRKKSKLTLLLEQLKPGESVALPIAKKDLTRKSAIASAAGKRMGVKFSFRAEGEGYRVFCIQRNVGIPVKPAKAQASQLNGSHAASW